MRLTDEQEEILATSGDIKVNAVAGSGKTTLLIEYAKSRPKNARILYLAFNRAVKEEAGRKFLACGLEQVKSETAHSLALRYFGKGLPFRIKASGYKSHEIADQLGLGGPGSKSDHFVMANHIKKFSSYFCNSDRQKVMELDYREQVADPEARAFVHKHYEQIEKGTRVFLAKMHQGKTDITHDFYLKQFQLEAHRLPYDHILFDEGQDASGAMLDVFLKDHCGRYAPADLQLALCGQFAGAGRLPGLQPE
jgi:hypothetical protein